MFEPFLNWLWQELALASSSLFALDKRVSLPYLGSALLFAFLVLGYRYRADCVNRIRPFWSKRIWWHPSARTDYGLWLSNHLLLAGGIPKTMTQTVWITGLFFFWQEQGVPDLDLGWSDTLVMILFSLSYFLLDDFSRFFTHWCFHKVPWLWAFHQVHHSAQVLTPFTVFRTHPIEGLLFFLRSLCIQSLCISLFLVLFPHQVSLMMVFGVFISTFIFNLLGANLRHSPVPLSYGPRLEKWFISPAQHQIHHSQAREHYDRNFGVVLALWDRLFGSWVVGSDDQDIRYGTGGKLDQLGVWGQCWFPFKAFARRVLRSVLSLGRKNNPNLDKNQLNKTVMK